MSGLSCRNRSKALIMPGAFRTGGAQKTCLPPASWPQANPLATIWASKCMRISSPFQASRSLRAKISGTCAEAAPAKSIAATNNCAPHVPAPFTRLGYRRQMREADKLTPADPSDLASHCATRAVRCVRILVLSRAREVVQTALLASEPVRRRGFKSVRRHRVANLLHFHRRAGDSAIGLLEVDGSDRVQIIVVAKIWLRLQRNG